MLFFTFSGFTVASLGIPTATITSRTVGSGVLYGLTNRITYMESCIFLYIPFLVWTLLKAVSLLDCSIIMSFTPPQPGWSSSPSPYAAAAACSTPLGLTKHHTCYRYSLLCHSIAHTVDVLWVPGFSASGDCILGPTGLKQSERQSSEGYHTQGTPQTVDWNIPSVFM